MKLAIVMGIYAMMGIIIIALPVFFETKTNRLLFILGMVITILSVSLIGAFITPPEIYDIYRHYLLMDEIRDNQWSFGYSIFKGIPESNSNYKSTYIYNILITLIAKLFPNEFLPFITSIICYSVFVYIFFKEFNGDINKEKNFVLSILLCSTLLPYLYIYSGIRNAMAASIAAFGIYRYFKVDGSVLYVCIWLVVALMVHPFAITAAIVLVMHIFSPKIKYFLFILIFPRLIEPIMEWCRLSSGNDFLFRIGAKYYNYTKVRVDDQGKVFLYVPIIMLLLLTVLLLGCSRKKRNDILNGIILNSKDTKAVKLEFVTQDDYLISGIWWYLILALGFINAENIILRFPFFLGGISPFIIKKTFYDELSRDCFSWIKLVSLIIITGASILILYENIAWLA